VLNPTQLKEHTLNRLGYGNGQWASNRYDELGFAGYVAEQLAQTLPAIVNNDVFIAPKINRGVVAQRQLECVLYDFWFNHFNVNVSSNNPESRSNNPIGRGLPAYQNEAIGPRVLGNFGDLVLATAKSTSMMSYLDNQSNRRPRTLPNGQIIGYNENYARELMELHTIGVDGGYTQTDVFEVARILTGWGHNYENSDPPNVFEYRDYHHDADAKTVMGIDYPAGRQIEEGEELISFLSNHPSAASFISTKMCKRFIGDNPPFRAVQSATAIFSDTGGDLSLVLADMFNGPDFATADEALFRSKAKPPHRYVTSALMAMGAVQVADWAPIAESLVADIIDAGDTPYFFGPPTGYPESPGFWLSPTSILNRFEIAESIAYEPGLVALLTARAGVDGSDIAQTFDAVLNVIMPSGVTATTEAAVKDHVAANAMTNTQRVSATAHMLFCSPEFLRY